MTPTWCCGTRAGCAARSSSTRSALVRAAESRCSCLELEKDTEKTEFAAAEFAAGRRVTGGAIRALVSAFSDDLAELAAACQQLLADASEEITEVTVEKYYSGRMETNAFKVAESGDRRPPRRGPRSAAPRPLLGGGPGFPSWPPSPPSCARWRASPVPTRGQSCASKFGLAPWQVDRARRDLHGWTDEGLGRSLETLADTDEQIKGLGRDPVFALERMIGVIASRGGSA